MPQSLGILRPIEHVVDGGEPQLGVIRVALELAQGKRDPRDRAIGLRDGVPGVLPALVVVAMTRARPIFLKTIVIDVAILVEPGHGRLDVWQVALEDRLVAAPLVQVGQDDDIEARRVVGSVIGRVRKEPKLGQLAVADLVRDLAWLHVPFRVVLGGLQPGQPPKGPRGEFRVASDALHRHDQGVATEQRHEPGNAPGRNEDPSLERGVFQAECLHVPGRLRPGVPNGFVGGVDAHPWQPGRPDVDRGIRNGIALERGGPAPAARDRQPLDAGVPRALRGNRRDEHQTAIRELRWGIGSLHPDHELAMEIAVVVGGTKLPT